jgi:hypothetical protein
VVTLPRGKDGASLLYCEAVFCHVPQSVWRGENKQREEWYGKQCASKRLSPIPSIRVPKVVGMMTLGSGARGGKVVVDMM